LDGANAHILVFGAGGCEDEGYPAAGFNKTLLEVGAADAGHSDIDNDTRQFSGLCRHEELVGGREEDASASYRSNKTAHGFTNTGIIIDDCNCRPGSRYHGVAAVHPQENLAS
jgi:hypothetical protein